MAQALQPDRIPAGSGQRLAHLHQGNLDARWPNLAGRTSLAEPRWPNYDPTPVRDYAQEQSFISDHARFPAAETALTGRRWCKT